MTSLADPAVVQRMERERESHVGKSLHELDTPAVIVDRAVVKRNCEQMDAMIEKVGVSFRPHIKTHKTVEATELMTGGPSSTTPINLIVSTLLELAHISRWLQHQQQTRNRHINILYGVPLPTHKISTLLHHSNALGPDAISVMIDHPSQLDALKALYLKPRAFIKIDTGYGRAGIPHSGESTSLRGLLRRMKEAQEEGYVNFLGFYSHGGDSYAVGDREAALGILGRELRGLGEAARIAGEEGLSGVEGKGFVLSVGATPTISVTWMNADPAAQGGEVPQVIKSLQESGHTVEFHGGNYPILDLQQIATSAGATSMIPLPHATYYQPRAVSDLALTVLAEVNSAYSERPTDERLITAGCLALGREPCKSYPGWGVVSEWPHGTTGTKGGIMAGSGWYVHAISQEHGRIERGAVPGVPAPVLDGEGGKKPVDWKVGDKVRIWPNHACIACANYPFFYVVDGEDESRGEKVVDIWARCVGW